MSPYRTTRDEFLLATKACVESKGFPVVLDLADGGFRFDLGTDARAREAKVALEECMASIDPARLELPPPLTEDQLRLVYAYRIEQLGCLAEAGYATPDAPPEQVYVDTAGAWDPFEALIEAGVFPSQEDLVRCQQLSEKRPLWFDW